MESDAKTLIDLVGSVLKKTSRVQTMMSGDGVELSRRTPHDIAAIQTDGVITIGR